MAEHCCEEMRQHLQRREVAIRYIPKFREYGIHIEDGGTSFQEIRFCPWCGRPLPPSLRDRWFEELDALGLEPDSPALSDRYKTDEWWKSRDRR
jgi:hypothetical protein